MKPFFTESGVEFFIERRRYGRSDWYAWVYYKDIQGELQSLGDPWPQMTPKRAEVMQAYMQENVYNPSPESLLQIPPK